MYSEVFGVWKQEWENSEVTKLPDGFFDRAKEYLNRLDEEIKSRVGNGFKLVLLKSEYANVLAMIDDLKVLRRKKIAKLWSEGKKFDATTLTPEESTALTNISTSPPKPEATAEAKLAVVRFLKDVPELVGSDLKYYGPFKPNDVGNLPVELATPLVTQGFAVDLIKTPPPEEEPEK
jgi:DNA replication initiation complex subunit (GINS family)